MFSAPLTGRKVFFITAGAFSVIIGVNLIFAFNAVRTFPGLEARNGYAPSQVFERDRDAQEALGWSTFAEYSDGKVILTILDADGAPLGLKLTAEVGRPTHTRNDRTLDFVFDGTVHTAPVELERGAWYLRVKTQAENGAPFRQRLSLWVSR